MEEMPRKMRKGLWSPDEDEKLSRCIAMYMNGSWSDIARKAGLERCGKSCRRRWMNHLRPDLKRGRFSPAEISRVVELHKGLGNRWSQIAGHLEGRTDNDVKNLWNTQIKRRFKQLAEAEASLDSSGTAGDAHVISVDSQDNDVVSSDPDDDGTWPHLNTPHLQMDHDGAEKTVSGSATAAPSSSSSLQRCAAPDHQDEDPLVCRRAPSSSNRTLECIEDSLPVETTLMSTVSNELIKPIKPVSVFTFPFSASPSMFCPDLQEETLNNLPLIVDVGDASGAFTGFPPMDPLRNMNGKNPSAVHEKCTSTRSHISPALSSTNLRKLDASRTYTRPRTDYTDFPRLMSEGDGLSIQNDCNIVGRLDQQKWMQVVQSTVEGNADQWHRSAAFDREASCGNIGTTDDHYSCPILEATMPNVTNNCSLPNMQCIESASCSSTESSTSTRSSTVDHLRSVLSVSQLESLGKAKAAAAFMNAPEGCSKENWQLMSNDGEAVVHKPDYVKELQLDGRSTVFCSSSTQGSSDDYDVGNWWSSLEMPSFELPNIEVDANCWQPTLSDVNFV